MPIPDIHKPFFADRLDQLEGWLTKERGEELYTLIRTEKPEVVVEIGVFGARSTISMALALRDNDHGTVYGIDPWKREDCLEGENDANKEWWSKVNLDNSHRLVMEAIWEMKLDEQIIIIRAASQHCAQMFPIIDLLLIDGNHAEVPSCRDVELYLPHVKHGGIILADDTDWESTRKMQALLEAECDILKVGDDGHYKLYRKR